MKRCVGLLLTVLAAHPAWSQEGLKNAPSTSSEPSTVRLVCEPIYQPTRAAWTRTVTVTYDKRRVNTVTIDGQPVYSFAIQQSVIFTSQDNERIQINVEALTWSSDFRGLSTAQGRCERRD